jgi:hypothetical protein
MSTVESEGGGGKVVLGDFVHSERSNGATRSEPRRRESARRRCFADIQVAAYESKQAVLAIHRLKQVIVDLNDSK